MKLLNLGRMSESYIEVINSYKRQVAVLIIEPINLSKMRRTKSQPLLTGNRRRIIQRGIDQDGGEYCLPYHLGAPLGAGGFASCHTISVDKEEREFAVKIFQKAGSRDRNIEKINTQIDIMSSLSHKNIVSFYRHFQNENNIYMIMELCKKGSLSEILHERQYLTEPEVRYILSQLVQALIYLKEKGIIHRDVKLANIFLDQNYQVKLGDFGLAIYSHSLQKNRICGTPQYIAPEIVEKKGYNNEVDVWSTGVVTYYMLVGTPPFQGKNVSKIYQKILENQLEFDKNESEEDIALSQYAKNLLRRMLTKNPKERIKLEDIMTHPFMASFTIPKELESTFEQYHPSLSFMEKYGSANKLRKAKGDDMQSYETCGLSSSYLAKNDSKNKKSFNRRAKLSITGSKIKKSSTRRTFQSVSNSKSKKNTRKRQPLSSSIDTVNYFKEMTKKFRQNTSQVQMITRRGSKTKEDNETIGNMCQQFLRVKDGLEKQIIFMIFQLKQDYRKDISVEGVARIVYFQRIEENSLLYLTNHQLIGVLFDDRSTVLYNLLESKGFYMERHEDIYAGINITQQIQGKCTSLIKPKIEIFKRHFKKMKIFVKKDENIKRAVSINTNVEFKLTFLRNFELSDDRSWFDMSNGDLSCLMDDFKSIVFSQKLQQIWCFDSNGLKSKAQMDRYNLFLQEDRKLVVNCKDAIESLVQIKQQEYKIKRSRENLTQSKSKKSRSKSEKKSSRKQKSNPKEERRTSVRRSKRHA